jgi:hypothetical protein
VENEELVNVPIGVEIMGETVYFDGKIKDLIFQNGIHYFDPEKIDSYKFDNVQSYITNKYGYRSPEFRQGTSLVFGGCSYTYGVGIPEDGIWGVQLAKMLGVGYANISRPGASVNWVVDSVLAYCREFGDPEYIVLAFPNFFRGTFIQNEDVLVSDGYNGDGVDRDVIFYNLMEVDVNNYPRLSKRPHIIDDVTPPEMPVYQAMRAIRVLEQYCDKAGVKLFWSFLEKGSETAARQIEQQYGFTSMVDLKRDQWINRYDPELYGWFKMVPHDGSVDITDCGCRKNSICSMYEKCHEDSRALWGDAFDLATDRVVSIENAHMGVHSQIHIAEDFMSAISKRS